MWFGGKAGSVSCKLERGIEGAASAGSRLSMPGAISFFRHSFLVNPSRLRQTSARIAIPLEGALAEIVSARRIPGPIGPRAVNAISPWLIPIRMVMPPAAARLCHSCPRQV